MSSWFNWFKKNSLPESKALPLPKASPPVRAFWRVNVDLTDHGNKLTEEIREWIGCEAQHTVFVVGLDLLKIIKHYVAQDCRIAIVDNKSGKIAAEFKNIRHRVEVVETEDKIAIDKAAAMKNVDEKEHASGESER